MTKYPWEVIPTFFKKEIQKAWPAGHPHVPKDKAGKTSDLAKERALAGTQDEKESL